ncbi:phospholipase/Carboxylesterase [Chloroherpeton thalassium ATCC 35110]|uniref:Phospholipase/Carboxylesterase n=1 Tax=Chloroherpeton thalassium (strain ATCC 35110 / GB-78) TaxID=517418 RepID=B3QX47_CHLT3|nr:dienelactone hydrolase family protein [Chloroherpeton thalassium]ACF14857.1 phospholipase/Carboxylesterase [Chloroherpeton thalassium ATCC 35110]
MLIENRALSLFHVLREPLQKTGETSPLLLLLHGYGSNEQDLIQLAPDLDDRFLVISPRAPEILGPGMFGWFPIEFHADGITVNPELAMLAQQKLLDFFDELLETYPVDHSKIFVMGFSQGAVMSYLAAFSQPEKVAGIVAMSGQIPPDDFFQTIDTAKLAELPVLTVHGLYDEVLPIEKGRESRKKLESLPVRLTYKEYPMGHQVSVESLNDIDAWLKAILKRRKAWL